MVQFNFHSGLFQTHSGLFSLIPWTTMGIFYSYVTSLAQVSAPTQGETVLTVLRGILCKLMMEYLTLYFRFVLFRMKILTPSHYLPFYFKACNKASILLSCEISTKLGVERHLGFNSSPDGKSNGTFD